ncbi:MAG: LysM peptidoglycan-binding domain-containing protein [Muribaculaceae bacterium]|nr:LysM peptidoglycan-binding domain-containing protein [Muribaculaceae bacterium]
MKKRFSILILSGMVAVGTAFSATKQNILTVRESFPDSTTVYPESFETDTEKLLQNWYVQNYTILDEEVESKSSNEVSEEEYIKRLSQIPATIEMPYNQEVRKYIDMYVNRRRTMVEAMLGMSLYYMPIFEQALEQEGMPLELKYLPIVESALDPVAKSRVGAAGLWQFMIRTGKGLGLEINSLVDERLDPYKSSVKAAKYLKQLYNIYKDWSLAIAAYNCGPGKVNQALRRAGGSGKDYWQIYAFLPKETRGYVPAFIAANYVMTYFKKHNISPALAKKPILVDTVQVTRRIHFNQISSVLDIPVEALRVLNPQYRKDVIPGNVRPYTLALPSQQIYSFLMSEDSIVSKNASKYQPRLVVEPQMTQVASDEGGEYEWETKTVTKIHKVRRGETLGGIAAKYKTTVSAIKKANGMRNNNIGVGKRLKIKTTERVKVYKPAAEETPEELAAADSLALEAAIAGANEEEVKKETPAPKKKPEPKKREEKKKAETKSKTKSKKQSASSGTHVVKSGESLYVIAERHGITVNELKRANSLSNNKIKPGQKLTIPKKKKSGNTSRSKAKSSRKR